MERRGMALFGAGTAQSGTSLHSIEASQLTNVKVWR
jgi:hypothetical protein